MKGLIHGTRHLAALSLALLSLWGCAAVPKAALSRTPGGKMETLQSPVSISMTTPGRSLVGRGFLVFKRPDRFHLAVLSPFGLTVLEVFIDGERVICLVPSRDTAYAGLLSELPDRNGLSSWRMLRWVVEFPTANAADGVKAGLAADGGKELAYFDGNGLLLRKVNEEGDQVVFGDYRLADGVPFPASIRLESRNGEVVKLDFDEPELNGPVDDAALTPRLEGIAVLPLAAFQGL